MNNCNFFNLKSGLHTGKACTPLAQITFSDISAFRLPPRCSNHPGINKISKLITPKASMFISFSFLLPYSQIHSSLLLFLFVAPVLFWSPELIKAEISSCIFHFLPSTCPYATSQPFFFLCLKST